MCRSSLDLAQCSVPASPCCAWTLAPASPWSTSYQVLSQAELALILDMEEEAYFASHSSGCEAAAAWPCQEVAKSHVQLDSQEEPTTLMVRNIACRLSSEQVLAHLADLGFEGSYDFFYLPIYRGGRSNQGYFFINFRTVDAARICKERLEGLAMGGGSKRCEVVTAEWQGLQELRKHFHKKSVTKSANRPLFL